MIDIIRFSDHVMYDYTRLPAADIAELQNQLNVNTCDENGETWFDDEIPVACVECIDEDEFFSRYFGENYDV